MALYSSHSVHPVHPRMTSSLQQHSTIGYPKSPPAPLTYGEDEIQMDALSIEKRPGYSLTVIRWGRFGRVPQPPRSISLTCSIVMPTVSG